LVRVCSLCSFEITPFDKLGVAISLGLGIRLLRDIARQICFRLPQLRCVPGEVRYHLLQLRFQWPGIDRKKQIAGLDVVAFLEVDLVQNTADLRLHRDR
jgi:hypothetical protein